MNPSPELFPEYIAVVEHGSISKAARVLGVPRASLSRRMGALEETLGVRLLHRQSRPMRLTPAGEELFRRAQRVLRETEDTWDAVRVHDDRPRGLLRVSLPPNTPLFVEFILQFAKKYPEVELLVSSDARHVDLLSERIDVAIRIGDVRDPELIARRIWRSKNLAVVASSYVRRAGLPQTVEELGEHPCMRTFDGTWHPSSFWPLRNGERVKVTGGLMCNDISLLVRAAQEGLGIAILPKDLIRDALASGELVPVLESEIGNETDGHVVYVERRFLLPQLRAFVDDLVDWCFPADIRTPSGTGDAPVDR
ncbi:MAG: LysR family transcriptional regulator [Nannocystaceae bacterium]|nr:LysR family transcriptional regulator [Nannocystaceae bacterium]